MLFWDIMQHTVVIPYQCFRTTNGPVFKRQEFHEEGNDRSYWNVGKELPPYDAKVSCKLHSHYRYLIFRMNSAFIFKRLEVQKEWHGIVT